MAAAQEMLDFKTFGEKGIRSGASSRSFAPNLPPMCGAKR
jgi:hypothetical protein